MTAYLFSALFAVTLLALTCSTIVVLLIAASALVEGHRNGLERVRLAEHNARTRSAYRHPAGRAL